MSKNMKHSPATLLVDLFNCLVTQVLISQSMAAAQCIYTLDVVKTLAEVQTEHHNGEERDLSD